MANDDPESEPATEGRQGHALHGNEGRDDDTASRSTTLDPVCGMVVDPATVAHEAEYEGERYVFCSAGCKAKFVADPQRYPASAGRHG